MKGFKFNAKVLRALKLSIKKWETKTKLRNPREVSYNFMSPYNCPLCKLFFFDHKCEGCPVKHKTGSRWCFRTPYKAASDAFFEWRELKFYGDSSKSDLQKAKSVYRERAAAELTFLKSLLPKKQTERKKRHD